MAKGLLVWADYHAQVGNDRFEFLRWFAEHRCLTCPTSMAALVIGFALPVQHTWNVYASFAGCDTSREMPSVERLVAARVGCRSAHVNMLMLALFLCQALAKPRPAPDPEIPQSHGGGGGGAGGEGVLLRSARLA